MYRLCLIFTIRYQHELQLSPPLKVGSKGMSGFMIMKNLAKLEFKILHVNDSYYLLWVLDVEMHLDAMNLGDTIKKENATTSQEKTKGIIFFVITFFYDLKSEYLIIKYPHML